MSKPNAHGIGQGHGKQGKDGLNDKAAFFLCCLIGFEMNGRNRWRANEPLIGTLTTNRERMQK